MKKIIPIILVVALALGIGTYYKIKTAKVTIDKIVPEKAVFYMRISDIDKQLEEFRAMRLWWNVRDIRTELLLRESGLPVEQIAQYNAAKAEFLRFVEELELDKFFAEEIAVAVYPSEVSVFDAPEALLDIASSIIFISRIDPEAEFSDLILKLCKKFNYQPLLKDQKYKEHELSIVELTDKVELAYAKIEDFLIIGLGRKPVHVCLDVINQDVPSLSKDKDYRLTRRKLSKTTQGITYINLELLLSSLKDLAEEAYERGQIPIDQKNEIMENFAKTAGFKTVGLASFAGENSKSKTVFTFDKAKMDPAVVKMYSIKPQKNETIDFVPRDVIAYQWTNWFDLELSWDNLQQEISKRPKAVSEGPDPADLIKGMEELLGVSIKEDIIPAVGGESGGFLADVNLEGPFPIPEILFFLKLKDKDTIDKAIDSLMSKSNLMAQSEQHRDISIKYVALPFGTSLQPAYCFLNDYLLISNKRDLLKESIDISNSKSVSLRDNKKFQDINFGLTDENNAVVFLETDVLLDKARQICEWGLSWVDLTAASLEASRKSAEEYLDKMMIEIKVKEEELWILENKLESLEGEIKSRRIQGLDVSSQQKRLAGLKTKVSEKKEEISLAKEELEEKEKSLQSMLSAGGAKGLDPELARLYLNELAYPILDGLKIIKAMGSRSFLSEDTFTTESFLKIEE